MPQARAGPRLACSEVRVSRLSPPACARNYVWVGRQCAVRQAGMRSSSTLVACQVVYPDRSRSESAFSESEN